MDPSTRYPDYIKGLQNHPTLEDLSQWARERVHPLIGSPSIRFFAIAGQKVAILKIPAGVNKPYCYYEPSTKGVTYFKKTSGGIAELTPDEIRELHRTQMLNQAVRLLRAAETQGTIPAAGATPQREMLERHKQAVAPKLENPKDFGLVGIYCLPLSSVEIPTDKLSQFLEMHRFHLSELMRHFPEIEVFQNGVSVWGFRTMPISVPGMPITDSEMMAITIPG
jgi:hypothetical protein